MSGYTLLFGYVEPLITLGSGVAAYVAPMKFAKFLLPYATKNLGNERDVTFYLQNFGSVCIFGAGALYSVFGFANQKNLKVPRQVRNTFLTFTAIGDLSLVLANFIALKGVPRSEWNWTAILGSAVFSLFLAVSRIAYISRKEEPEPIIN